MKINLLLDQMDVPRLIYDTYPDSDMLDVDPDEDLMSAASAYAYATAGRPQDGLFRFLLIEVIEGVEGIDDLSQFHTAVQNLLQRASFDVMAVMRGFTRRRKEDERDGHC